MFDAVAVCICTEIKPTSRHNCGNSRIRLSEQSASAARFKRIQRTERVKYIANMWISWTGLWRVVHKLSTSIILMISNCNLQRDESIDDDSILNLDDFAALALVRHFDDAHWWPHPLPLKWIGLAVQILSIVIMQYGHPGGFTSSSNSALTGLTSLHTGHLNS